MPKRTPRQPKPPPPPATPPTDSVFNYNSLDDIAYMPAGEGPPPIPPEVVAAHFAARFERMEAEELAAAQRRKRRR